MVRLRSTGLDGYTNTLRQLSVTARRPLCSSHSAVYRNGHWRESVAATTYMVQLRGIPRRDRETFQLDQCVDSSGGGLDRQRPGRWWPASNPIACGWAI